MAKKILIIEDEPLVARVYEKSLKFKEYDVISARNGKDGLDLIKKEKPDLVLLDVMMPEMNGMQVLEEAMTDPETKNIPIVMLSNLSGRHDAELALSKGAVEYWVKKDAKPLDLGTKIEELLSKTASNNVD
ncbi:MAG: PleD family two-component system response regulator [Candidatus Nitrosomaritimum yanchengensis]